jgi:hypothetical protein
MDKDTWDKQGKVHIYELEKGPILGEDNDSD